MNIELIKQYTFGAKPKKVGTIMEVTNGLGEHLISKGIAIVFTGEVKILKETKNKKQDNIKEKNSNFTNNNEDEIPHTKDKK